MKRRDNLQRNGAIKAKKTFYALVLLICCNILGLGLATSFGYSLSSSDQPAISASSADLSAQSITDEAIRTQRNRERAARAVRARQEREKDVITLNENQKKKLALLLLVVGGQARISHL